MATIEAIKQAYKLGFAERLARRGITPDQVQAACVTKQADTVGSVAEAAGQAGSRGLDVLKSLAHLGLLVPPLVGGAIGYGLERSKVVSPADLQHVKDVALLRDYKAAITRLQKEQERERQRRNTGID
jgi:hypothetical protein